MSSSGKRLTIIVTMPVNEIAIVSEGPLVDPTEDGWVRSGPWPRPSRIAGPFIGFERPMICRRTQAIEPASAIFVTRSGESRPESCSAYSPNAGRCGLLRPLGSAPGTASVSKWPAKPIRYEVGRSRMQRPPRLHWKRGGRYALKVRSGNQLTLTSTLSGMVMSVSSPPNPSWSRNKNSRHQHDDHEQHNGQHTATAAATGIDDGHPFLGFTFVSHWFHSLNRFR